MEKKKTCWNCTWYNGNEVNCDYYEETTSKSEPCSYFKDDKNFPEEL